MLLKSIKLENFRQFRNESIDFAQGENGKNVTIMSLLGKMEPGKRLLHKPSSGACMEKQSFQIRLSLTKLLLLK